MSQLLRRPKATPVSRTLDQGCESPLTLRVIGFDTPELRDRTADQATAERLRTTTLLLHIYAAALAFGWAVLLLAACEFGRKPY